ncbi:MAG: transposase family protein [Deltaproteobacteria bacterium]|nr:transposase family protein [Deltaproteobacteria bacterium]
MEEAIGMSAKDHFPQLSDPRILRKTHHKVVDIKVITLGAVIADADDWVEIAALGKEKEQRFKTFLELPGEISSRDTLGRLFSADLF